LHEDGSNSDSGSIGEYEALFDDNSEGEWTGVHRLIVQNLPNFYLFFVYLFLIFRNCWICIQLSATSENFVDVWYQMNGWTWFQIVAWIPFCPVCVDRNMQKSATKSTETFGFFPPQVLFCSHRKFLVFDLKRLDDSVVYCRV
jgi:hypothetical protein